MEISSPSKLESSLQGLPRRELQSLAKQYGIRANSKSSEIVAQMLTYCKNKLKATPIVGDILFSRANDGPKANDDAKQDSLTVYENKAFDTGAALEVTAEDKTVPQEPAADLVKAYEEGKAKGIWFGRMHQKLEDLETRWNGYLATSKRTRIKRETKLTPIGKRLKGRNGKKKKKSRSLIQKPTVSSLRKRREGRHALS